MDWISVSIELFREIKNNDNKLASSTLLQIQKGEQTTWVQLNQDSAKTNCERDDVKIA